MVNTVDNRPLLSIIVPTRNRAQYAIPCIKSILNITSFSFELIVQDNSDNNELENFIVNNINDERLKYNHILDQVDIVSNFNLATDLSNGEYICFIGDDDGINQSIIKYVSWAKNQEIDAVITTRPVQYYWPDIYFKLYKRTFSGTLIIKPFSSKVFFVDPHKELVKCINTAGSNFLLSNLPRVYYGIVRRKHLVEVRQRTGTYFPGPSPDLAGALAVTNFVKRVCCIDYPLFIPGSSGKSGAGWGANKKHLGDLSSFSHIPPYYINNWSKLVPPYFSGNTIWGENVVQVLKALGNDHLIKNFNVPLLHAKCAVFNPSYIKLIINNLYKALNELEINYLVGTIKFVFYYLYTWGQRAKSFSENIFRANSWGRSHIIAELNDVEDAGIALNKFLLGNCKMHSDTYSKRP